MTAIRQRLTAAVAVAASTLFVPAPAALSAAVPPPLPDPPYAVVVAPTSPGPVVVSSSGAVSKPIAALPGLGFIVRHPTLPVFYVAGERSARGRVSAFTLDAGRARLLGSVTTGAAPVDIAVDPLGRFLLTADYNGGSVTRVTLSDQGRPTKSSTVKVPAGSGPVLSRQSAAHPHSAAISADSRFAVISDLGGDALHMYETNTLRLIGTERLPAGTGPRTIVFVDAFTLVVSEELSGSVSWWRFDAGRLQLEQRFALTTTIPSDVIVSGESSSGPSVLVIGRGTDELIEISATGTGRRWPLGRCGARVGRWSSDGNLVLTCAKTGQLRRLRLDPGGTLTEGPLSTLAVISGVAFV
jgi:hypothetical protein